MSLIEKITCEECLAYFPEDMKEMDECHDCGWRCEYMQSHIHHCGGAGCEWVRERFNVKFDEEGELTAKYICKHDRRESECFPTNPKNGDVYSGHQRYCYDEEARSWFELEALGDNLQGKIEQERREEMWEAEIEEQEQEKAFSVSATITVTYYNLASRTENEKFKRIHMRRIVKSKDTRKEAIEAYKYRMYEEFGINHNTPEHWFVLKFENYSVKDDNGKEVKQ